MDGGLGRWVPGVETIRRYERHDLRHDVVAGLVLTAFLLPVGMAYAQVAGVPPVHGLYATIVPLVVYALLGPSRVLVLGPDSSLAPLIAATVLPLAMGDPERAVFVAAAVAVGAGAICLLAGLARFGFVTELLSIPVRHGYLNGVVAVVIVSQVPVALGIEIEAANTVERADRTVRSLLDGEARALPLVIALASFVGIVALRRVVPWLPGVLIAVVASIAVVAVFDLEGDLDLVGTLPAGLPSIVVPELRWADVGPIAVGSLTVALVALTDTSLLSRAFAARRGQRVDPDRELVALGAANLATGFAQGFGVSASSSRTPIAIASGARTQLTNVIAAAAIAVLLVGAPGALRLLPTATLAAVVIAAVSELFEVRALRQLARTRPTELVLSLVAFAGVVLLGVVWGVAIAVAFSLLALIQRAWRPYTTTLVRVRGRKGYHDAARNPDGRQIPGLALYRFDAPMFFANAALFREQVIELTTRRGDPVRWVVVAAGSITEVDATADQMLLELHDELEELGVTLAFAELRGVVRDRLERSGTHAVIGPERFFPTVGRAVSAYVDETGTDWVDWEDEPGRQDWE